MPHEYCAKPLTPTPSRKGRGGFLSVRHPFSRCMHAMGLWTRVRTSPGPVPIKQRRYRTMAALQTQGGIR